MSVLVRLFSSRHYCDSNRHRLSKFAVDDAGVGFGGVGSAGVGFRRRRRWFARRRQVRGRRRALSIKWNGLTSRFTLRFPTRRKARRDWGTAVVLATMASGTNTQKRKITAEKEGPGKKTYGP